ncbi:MAG: tetratricopeptide repeat protein [Mastigocoleus sp.]
MNLRLLKYLGVAVTISTLIVLFYTSETVAKTRKSKVPDKFPPSPLEITTPDPLLPKTSKNQPLSSQEKQNLAVALDRLNQEAAAKLVSGDKQAAFDIWNRELRLRRYLGTLPEIQALSRVGEIAWRQNNSLQVRYLTQRLQKIQESIQDSTKKKKKKENRQLQQQQASLEVLQALANAFVIVRTPKNALAVYDKILERVEIKNNLQAKISTLENVAAIHMSWFDYVQAAKVYESLLNLISVDGTNNLQTNPSFNRQVYLEELAYIYNQTKQIQNSIDTRKKLVEIYRQTNNISKIPELRIAIGSNYESLAKKNTNLLENAFQSYQEAYTIAWQLQQYVRAGEALEKLIPLYLSQGQTEEALQTSEILLQTQKRASNFYGVMEAYDEIGKINLQRQNYPQALAAFQQGLDIAKQLQHQQEYFTQQVNNLSGKVSN